jgi:WD40 repeat protein
LFILKGHTGYVYSVVFSPDGRRIVTGSQDNAAKVWDAETWRETLTLNGHTSGIYSIAISADGKSIATGSQDKTIKVWISDRDRR